MKFTYVILLLIFSPISFANSSNEIKVLINNYYSMPDRAHKLDWENEVSAKHELSNMLNQILMEPEINKWKKFIKTTSAHSSYFSIVFDEITPIDKIKWKSISSVNDTTIKAVIIRKKQSYFTESENLPDISRFVSDYKITNYSQSELNDLRADTLIPEAMEYIVTSKVEVEFILIRKDDSLRISSIKQIKVLSSILEIMFP